MNQNIEKRTMLTYNDVVLIPAAENGEKLVDVRTCDDSIITEYRKADMAPYTRERIFVRDSVARKLAAVQAALSKNGRKLKVVYGYRHPEVQEKYFLRQRTLLAKQNSSLSPDELDALTHLFVAVPNVAGHPTGGAVDLTFVDFDGSEADMGTTIADFSDAERIKTFAEGLSQLQARNRQILHDAMVREGFAPFYGEWWHFSYGDKEWASFYGKPESLYSPLKFNLE